MQLWTTVTFQTNWQKQKFVQSITKMIHAKKSITDLLVSCQSCPKFWTDHEWGDELVFCRYIIFIAIWLSSRLQYNTQHTLFRVAETWKQCLDMSGIVGIILMDLSTAYDCIQHELLIAKLEAYRFKRNSLKLVCSYLTNRAQRVKIGSLCSAPKHVSTGVPQGSALGPLLFNVFQTTCFIWNWNRRCITLLIHL